ncbi:vitellogenin receptor-like, partial [Musca vetustissima]|uniref:vitellogenin receptor-like n=1 Tax=Musca vetustissima TaxID=27455 RepID=UPI002AB70D51
ISVCLFFFPDNAAKCNEGQFRCKASHKCIPNNWVCDGEFDCGDLDTSDEINCPSDSLKCLSYQRECGNGVCLDISKFCDGNWDCDNDELKCDKQDAECSTLKCSFNCKLTPQGPTCYCAPGQMPVNNTQCVDFDECTIEGICDHQCHNTPGSYECSCAPGYSKQRNRCYAINVPKDEPASLVFITQTDVRRIDPNNGTTLAIVNAVDISAVEIWHRNRSLCTAEASMWTTTELKCYRIDDMNVTWALPLPELITSTHVRAELISSHRHWHHRSSSSSSFWSSTSPVETFSVIVTGGGMGSFTRYILNKMRNRTPPCGTLILILQYLHFWSRNSTMPCRTLR